MLNPPARVLVRVAFVLPAFACLDAADEPGLVKADRHQAKDELVAGPRPDALALDVAGPFVRARRLIGGGEDRLGDGPEACPVRFDRFAVERRCHSGQRHEEREDDCVHGRRPYPPTEGPVKRARRPIGQE